MKDNDKAREQLAKKLRESEEFAFSLLNSSPNPMIVINPDTSIKYVNLALTKLTGFPSGEIIGTKAPYPWWTEETLEKTGEDLKKAMRGEAIKLEKLFRKKNGERFWVEIAPGPIIREGEFKYYISNWTDITERKKAEKKMEKAFQMTRDILEKSPFGIYVVDSKGNIEYVNPTMIKIAGDSFKQFKDMNAFELPTYRELGINDKIKAAVKGEGFFAGPVEYTSYFGKKTTVRNFIGMPFEEYGEKKALVFVEDITERRKTETELKESGLKLKEQKRALEEKNIALNELIGQIELEKRRVKEEIATNVDEILLPIVERLGMKGVSRKYGELLKYHLESISSSFGREITRKARKLTPREIEICSVIKGGLTNKEISRVLNISYQTVEKHRKNIRKKLDLSDKKVNLTTYLNHI